jgi:hypothetical protein
MKELPDRPQDRFIFAAIDALLEALSTLLGWPNNARRQHMAEMMVDRFLALQVRRASEPTRSLWQRIALSPNLPQWCAAFYCEAEGIRAGLAGFVVYKNNDENGPDAEWGGHGWGRILGRARTKSHA